MIIFLFIILFSPLFSQFHDRCPDILNHRSDPIDLDFDVSYESASGHFLVHYNISGDDALTLLDDNDDNTVPDYIEQVALAADEARVMLTDSINGLGYLEEIDDADGKYDIYMTNLGNSYWGITYPIDYVCTLDPTIICNSTSCNSDNSCGEDCGECEAVSSSHDGSSYIELRHNGYEGMSDSCDDSNDLLWLTVGHEFFHAVQHAYKKNASTTDRYYREFTSMWFEGVFVPACFDFLNFVDMHSSYSLFNHPEKAFDEEASNGYYGYSLALYGHYLSTLVDSKGLESQLNSTIMKEIWDDYKGSSSTIFNSLKNVLEENYEVSFSETWADFMSRNMFCSEFSSMEDNEIYYHEGLTLIDPPDINYQNLTTTSNWELNNETLGNDRVSIYGFESIDGMSATANFSTGDYISWYGEISNQSLRENISGISTYPISDLFNSDKFFFLFSTENNSESIDLTIDMDVYGCIDEGALNYNSSANIDDESCEYSNQILSIYPNPIDLGSSALYIGLVQSESSNVNIEIFNLSGESIYKRNFSIYGEGLHEISLGLMSNLASGVYFVHIKHLGSSKTLKFVNIK